MAYGLSNSHVTDDVMWPPQVLWGSTVGYPSDSLAFCHQYVQCAASFAGARAPVDCYHHRLLRIKCSTQRTYIIFIRYSNIKTLQKTWNSTNMSLARGVFELVSVQARAVSWRDVMGRVGKWTAQLESRDLENGLPTDGESGRLAGRPVMLWLQFSFRHFRDERTCCWRISNIALLLLSDCQCR